MPAIKATITVPLSLQQPEDVEWTTTMYFNAEETVTTMDLLVNVVGRFQGLVNAVGDIDRWSSCLDFSECRFKLYTLNPATGQTGSPFRELVQDIASYAGSQTDTLPTSTRLAATYHADLTGVPIETPFPPVGPQGNQRNQARLMGRHFIGPFSAGVMRDDGRATDEIIDAIATWHELQYGLAAGLTDSGDVLYRQYSRTLGQLHAVVGNWVDDRLDTQQGTDMPASRAAIRGESNGPALD